MLWIIESSDIVQQELSPVFKADVERLGNNTVSLGSELEQVETSYTRKQVFEPYSGDLGTQDIFVLAHSGYAEREGFNEVQPWIGGLWFDEFADAVVSKFGKDRLRDRTIWFLICLTGQDVDVLGPLLARSQVTNCTWYMPNDFMYISQLGIPHILTGFDDIDEANKEVAKYDADFTSLTASKPCGDGWAGASLTSGKTNVMPSMAVTEALRDRFDVEGEES